MLWFEEIWRDREERIYTELFGPLPGTVIPLKAESLRAILGPNATINDEWLHFAVIELAPNSKHADWIYVTSAFSQPWKVEDPATLDPNGKSGFGYELLLRSPERAGWAVDVLHRLTAYQIGVYYELMRGKLFDYYDWMPLNGPISPRVPNSPVRGMFITHPRDFEEHFQLRSGHVDFLQIVGITGEELAFGLYRGLSLLERALYEHGAAPTTNPARASLDFGQNYSLPQQLAGKF